MDVIRELTDFLDSGRVSQRLRALEALVGPYELRIVAMMLATWLSFQNRWPKKRPMSVPSDDGWRVNLVACLEADAEMDSLFVLSGNTLDFRDAVDEQSRNEIRAYVDAHVESGVMEGQ